MKLSALSADWQTLSALLDEALELPPEARVAWLAALAGPAAVHRETIARLIEPAAILERENRYAAPPRFDARTEAGADAPAGPAASDEVGPYRLLSELGRGGMGAVWLAERVDAQPRRKVALKLPHLGWAPGLAARLGRERDILASLEHPNIARLYDAGVDRLGRPYLALEYVAGTPIDRYAQAHHATLRQRLALILQVAAAVAHAHTRLVVHRDLKPSNILVTESGEVRLLDFGIAKLLASEDDGTAGELTRLAGRALTPDYASPEQIRGEPIGTASDVYSLGVVAYELLAGARPYRIGDEAGSLAEAIARVEVPLASRAGDAASRRQLDGDLDAILNKALKKSQAERYATVAAFADDIERHLRQAPVTARPDRLAYRARKFVARHALQVGAGALVVLALLLGAGVALWQARAARFEAARAEQVKNFTLAIFEGANADSGGAGSATSAVDLLKIAQAKVESELGERPETAVELMSAIGSGLLSQGSDDDAAALLKKALDLSTRVLGENHPRTLNAATLYSHALNELGRRKEVIALLPPVIAEARRQGRVGIEVQALGSLASAQLDVGAIDAGVASARAAASAVDAPGTQVDKVDAMEAWAALANALGFAQRPGQADAARRSLVLAKEIYGDRISVPVLVARSHLAKGLADEGQTSAGIDELAAALRDSLRFLGPTHPETETIANFLGNARLGAGDPLGAVEAFRVAVAAVDPRTGDVSAAARGIEHYGLGAALAAARQDEAALPEFAAAARLLRQDGGPDAPIALRALSSRALALARLGRLDEAEQAFAELAGAKWSPLDKAADDGRRALLRSLQGRHVDAVALASSAATAFAAVPSPVARAGSDRTLGLVLLAANRPAEAIAPLQRAVDVYAERYIAMAPDRVDTIAALDRARRSASAEAGSAATR